MMIALSRFAYLFLIGLIAVSPDISSAEVMPAPEGEVILTVTGKITRTNSSGAAGFDIEMLKKLGIKSFTSENKWIRGVHKFEGFTPKSLLDAVGATGTEVRATALNDYSVPIPISDLVDTPALVVFRIDGKYISVRENGPLWILYPQGDDFEMYGKPKFLNYMIWQLFQIEIR